MLLGLHCGVDGVHRRGHLLARGLLGDVDDGLVAERVRQLVLVRISVAHSLNYI